MSAWRHDKKWSDIFIPGIKRVLGEYLIGEPPIEEDQERNTDLMVLKMDSVRIGCRIRRNQYISQYSDEFTIRAGRPSGIKTELTKIVEGWGDYFFYGFSNKNETDLEMWRLCDLKVFRLWFNQEILRRQQMPGIQKPNFDNSSNFIAFNFNDLPNDFVVGSYGITTKAA